MIEEEEEGVRHVRPHHRTRGRRARHPRRRAPLTLDELRALVDAGEVHTVALAFTDMQGRLQGKRFAAGFFLDEVAEHGADACEYLLAVDVELNTVDGYALSSWETGYGDFAMRPDLSTLRLTPGSPAPPRSPPTWPAAAATRSPPRPANCCAARSPASPSTAWPPTSAPSWSSWSSATPTNRPGRAATAG